MLTLVGRRLSTARTPLTRLPLNARTMAASTEVPKFLYLAVIKDLPDSKRMSVRPQHLANAAESRKAGILVDGGALFSDDQAKQDGSAKMDGSWMLFHAENMEKAREWIANDIYTTGGAWDMNNLQLTSVGRPTHH